MFCNFKGLNIYIENGLSSLGQYDPKFPDKTTDSNCKILRLEAYYRTLSLVRRIANIIGLAIKLSFSPLSLVTDIAPKPGSSWKKLTAESGCLFMEVIEMIGVIGASVLSLPFKRSGSPILPILVRFEKTIERFSGEGLYKNKIKTLISEIEGDIKSLKEWENLASDVNLNDAEIKKFIDRLEIIRDNLNLSHFELEKARQFERRVCRNYNFYHTLKKKSIELVELKAQLVRKVTQVNESYFQSLCKMEPMFVPKGALDLSPTKQVRIRVEFAPQSLEPIFLAKYMLNLIKEEKEKIDAELATIERRCKALVSLMEEFKDCKILNRSEADQHCTTFKKIGEHYTRFRKEHSEYQLNYSLREVVKKDCVQLSAFEEKIIDLLQSCMNEIKGCWEGLKRTSLEVMDPQGDDFSSRAEFYKKNIIEDCKILDGILLDTNTQLNCFGNICTTIKGSWMGYPSENLEIFLQFGENIKGSGEGLSKYIEGKNKCALVYLNFTAMEGNIRNSLSNIENIKNNTGILIREQQALLKPVIAIFQDSQKIIEDSSWETQPIQYQLEFLMKLLRLISKDNAESLQRKIRRVKFIAHPDQNGTKEDFQERLNLYAELSKRLEIIVQHT